MSMTRFFLVWLMMTSTVLMVSAEDTPVDDVDRTDFSDPSLDAELDKVKEATGPHSEVESASLLMDLVDDKVPVGVPSYLLVSLANMGPKHFNVSAIVGTISSSDGKEVQKFPKQEYGDTLGPREQRSVRYGFTPKEETPIGQYKLEFKIFYNNREKDNFVDTVYSDMSSLAPKPPDVEAQLQMIKAFGGIVLTLVLLLLAVRSLGGKSKSDKPGKTEAKAALPTGGDEWLAATLAGTENQAAKKRKGKK